MKLGYARVSTGEQNIEMQLDALTAAGAERMFRDTATGANVDRPGLADLLEHVREGDVVVVWELFRFARSLRELIDLVGDLEKRDVKFISLKENIDTTTAMGRFFFHVMGAMGEFERNRLIERTNAGLAAARARGRKGGRKPALDANKQKTVQTLLDAARDKGKDPDLKAIASSVGASERTIRRFADGVYAGAAV